MIRLALIALFICAGALADDAAHFGFSGVAENRFNPIRGELTAHLRGAIIADTPDAVSVFVNDQRVDDEAVTVRDQVIIVDFLFADGVNDLLLLAQSDSGATLRGDALLWAGDNTLVVDVVDDDMTPIEAAEVSVALASNTAIVARRPTASGTARFENLPSLPLLVRAKTKSGRVVSAASRGDAGALLLSLAVGDM